MPFNWNRRFSLAATRLNTIELCDYTCRGISADYFLDSSSALGASALVPSGL